jgi:hypothetical protein
MKVSAIPEISLMSNVKGSGLTHVDTYIDSNSSNIAKTSGTNILLKVLCLSSGSTNPNAFENVLKSLVQHRIFETHKKTSQKNIV